MVVPFGEGGRGRLVGLVLRGRYKGLIVALGIGNGRLVVVRDINDSGLRDYIGPLKQHQQEHWQQPGCRATHTICLIALSSFWQSLISTEELC